MTWSLSSLPCLYNRLDLLNRAHVPVSVLCKAYGNTAVLARRRVSGGMSGTQVVMSAMRRSHAALAHLSPSGLICAILFLNNVVMEVMQRILCPGRTSALELLFCRQCGISARQASFQEVQPQALTRALCPGGTFALYSLLCRHVGITPGSRSSKAVDPADVLLSHYSSASELGTPAGPAPRRCSLGVLLRDGLKKSKAAQSVRSALHCLPEAFSRREDSSEPCLCGHFALQLARRAPARRPQGLGAWYCSSAQASHGLYCLHVIQIL